MYSILISGISGKVGSQILKLAPLYSFSVVCGIDRKTFTEADCPIYTSFSEVKENVDIVVDFSSPALTEKAIEFCFDRRCALISGTTALLSTQKIKLQELSKRVPVCYSTNYSQSVNTFIECASVLNKTLNGFDLTLVELHNKNKKDAPSGTAKTIAEKLNIENIHSIRGGSISGEHKLIFLGDGEEIEFSHRTFDKSIFAKGALRCATTLLEKEKGLYDLSLLLTTARP